jgi:hypothetical protein
MNPFNLISKIFSGSSEINKISSNEKINRENKSSQIIQSESPGLAIISSPINLKEFQSIPEYPINSKENIEKTTNNPNFDEKNNNLDEKDNLLKIKQTISLNSRTPFNTPSSSISTISFETNQSPILQQSSSDLSYNPSISTSTSSGDSLSIESDTCSLKSNLSNSNNYNIYTGLESESSNSVSSSSSISTSSKQNILDGSFVISKEIQFSPSNSKFSVNQNLSLFTEENIQKEENNKNILDYNKLNDNSNNNNRDIEENSFFDSDKSSRKLTSQEKDFDETPDLIDNPFIQKKQEPETKKRKKSNNKSICVAKKTLRNTEERKKYYKGENVYNY